MATSRRRERELARRRYERRRMREMERRAKQRRRNTILGASLGTVAVIAAIVLLALHLSGGSDKSKTSALTTPTPSATTSTSPTPPPAAPTKCAPIKPNPPAKGQPRIPDVTGKAPTKLVVKDVKVGKGRAAKKGDTVSVLYIGASCSDGTIFDASYKHGNQAFPVQNLGKAQVIAGWNQGLIGVKPGGIRELIIPASLGYGPQGSPPTIKGNETLIFLITVKSVKA